jgi:hypothetical protein
VVDAAEVAGDDTFDIHCALSSTSRSTYALTFEPRSTCDCMRVVGRRRRVNSTVIEWQCVMHVSATMRAMFCVSCVGVGLFG